MNEDDLRQVFFAMRPHNENSAHGAWANHGNSLRHHVLNETTDHFLRWSTMIATMVVGSTPFIEAEYELLPASIKEAIVDSRFGDPLMLMGDQTSASYSHQAFHLYQWSAMTGKTMREIRSIVEFGGGYGAMAVVARALGFTGEYTIFDLPEFSAIQRYYLSNVGCAANFVSAWDWDRAKHRDTDMLIAVYSLSETRSDFREQFFDAVQPNHCLIVHQGVWEGESLNPYFEEFMRNRPQYDWVSRRYFHSQFPDHFYRVGTRSVNV